MAVCSSEAPSSCLSCEDGCGSNHPEGPRDHNDFHSTGQPGRWTRRKEKPFQHNAC